MGMSSGDDGTVESGDGCGFGGSGLGEGIVFEVCGGKAWEILGEGMGAARTILILPGFQTLISEKQQLLMAALRNSFSMTILVILVLCCLTTHANARVPSEKLNWKRLIIVDQSGKGNYTKIQDAIDAVPSNNVDSILIRVEPGIYEEKVLVPLDKPFIILSGRIAGTTIISWADSGDIWDSPTLTVLASDFVGRYLTIQGFQNTYGEGAKAVALRVTSDRAEFTACRITSYQDTLLDERGRHFYNNCYIEGGTDFIFGNAESLFQNCHIHSISKRNGAITAQKRETTEEETGFYFMGGRVTGIESCTLGRPWGPYSRVVFMNTYMGNAVNPEGWDDWGKPFTHNSVYYGEYKCYGPGANRSNRVQWSLNLTDQQVSGFYKYLRSPTSWLKR
ncbi:putative pectinesterase 11 [Silene latifolia]|uniref:putative pectinesterase 11 n=1 Tax=Silene latifolia TaxID=37657 RepID=UPI003D77F001